MTHPDVFIIESLTFKDERKKRFEGLILSDMLRLLEKKPIYYYVRTRKELHAVLNRFGKSRYRYLHLSCHGDEETISTTLDEGIEFHDLSTTLNKYLKSRRLFVSSCDVVNDQFAQAVMPSGCLSIAGPTHEVGFAEAAVLWTSFYYLAFFRNNNRWKGKTLTSILEELAPLLAMNLTYYGRSGNSSQCYQRKTYGRD